MATTFEPADARRDRAVLTELNIAYLDWLDANIQQTFGLDLPWLLGAADRRVRRRHARQAVRSGAT